MKIRCSKYGTITIVAETGAEDYFLSRFFPDKGGGIEITMVGSEFTDISTRHLSITLSPISIGDTEKEQ